MSMEHTCFRCKHTWWDHEMHPTCWQCGSGDVVDSWDEEQDYYGAPEPEDEDSDEPTL